MQTLCLQTPIYAARLCSEWLHQLPTTAPRILQDAETIDIKGKIISLLRATHTEDQDVGSREEVRKTHPTAPESLDLQKFKSVNLPTIVWWGFLHKKIQRTWFSLESQNRL